MPIIYNTLHTYMILYILHVYTSSCELHSLKVAAGEKEPQPGAQTRGLHSNTEFQPQEPPMWPQFFVSNRRIHGHRRAAIL